MPPDREGPRPPSSRDVAGEDFLFHLYRGSELLQDNRVHDAKAELEQALSLQPSDPKGQDLLGIVYFRLGLYPRAITIYEQLIKAHPEAIEPRINLALSYLKTGQPSQARFELEKVVEQSPQHSRAWGYLGLAFQRLGDMERATYAFQAGGHDGMARRLNETSVPSVSGLSLRPEPPMPARAEARRAAAEALEEISRDDDTTDVDGLPSRGAFRPAEERRSHTPAPWSAIEPGRLPIAPPPLVPSINPVGEAPAHAPAPAHPVARFADSVPLSARPVVTGARSPSEVARESLLVFPRDLPVALHERGLVLVQAQSGFVTRLDAVRAMSHAGVKTQVIWRKTRGRVLEEPLGGAGAPLLELPGKGELILGPAPGQKLRALSLDEDALYLREDALVGFEPGVTHENGRLAVGDGDALPMVQLRGPGAVIASFPEQLAAIEVSEGKGSAVRAISVMGWVGRVVPRALLPSEAPGGARGFVAFAGEGMVLVDGR